MRRIKILVLKKNNNKVKEDETGATYASRRREMYAGFGVNPVRKVRLKSSRLIMGLYLKQIYRIRGYGLDLSHLGQSPTN